MNRDFEPATSASLLRDAQQGDPESWQKIGQLYGPIIYAWARRCGCQAADAADIMQETLTAVSRGLADFDHQRNDATFRGWLWTITRNKLRDLERRRDTGGAGGSSQEAISFHRCCNREIGRESVAPIAKRCQVKASDASPGNKHPKKQQSPRDDSRPPSWRHVLLQLGDL